MKLVKIEAEKYYDGLSPKILHHFDESIDKASVLIDQLGSVDHATDDNISASIRLK